MKINRFLSLLLAAIMTVSTLLSTAVIFPSAAEAAETGTPAETPTTAEHPYVSAGLVALYSGTQNTRAGHDTAATVWEDLVGGYDVPVKTADGNTFTETGYHHKAAQNYFPQGIVDVINGQAFTLEFYISALAPVAPAYCTMFNSANDNFALFRRNSSDELEFKFAANAAGSRNKIPGCTALLQDAVVTVTYTVGGQSCIYINGELMSEMPASSPMGADNFFFGHAEGNRHFEADYRSIRIYDRALSKGEILRNCMADGLISVTDLYVTDGLVSLYSGMDIGETAGVWADLVGDNHLTVNLDDKNYFTDDGLRAGSVRHRFPQGIVDLVNGNAFTVELQFGAFESIGTDFNTFLNSSNDNFALFRRNAPDQLEFKFAGNTGGERHKIDGGLELLQNGLITVTYEVGGECVIYVNGERKDAKLSPKAMGADDLYIGHESAQKSFDTTYRTMRFYSRALTAEEVAANAAADGYTVTNIPGFSTPGYVTVAQPQTNIVGDIAMVRPIRSANGLNQLIKEEKKPAVAIYWINDKLEVLENQNTPFSTVADVLTATEWKVLSAFYVADVATAEALADFLKSINFYDCFVMSADPAAVAAARKIAPAVSGVIDFTETYKDATSLSEAQCLDIRRVMKANSGTVAMLPAALCRNETVQYLYARQVNVWACMDDGDTGPTKTECYNALLSGAVGVVSNDTSTLLSIACEKLPAGTATRVATNIGHRGIPSKAPENTLEGAILAYESGANVVEIDVYLTTDGQVVVMHDGTTGRTCDKNLNQEACTLAELKELYVNKGFENHETFSKCRIPTMDEYLEYFKGKDCNIFVEIKSGNVAIVPAVKALIDKYDMYSQCSVITFNEPIMAAMRKDYPEMSVGALCSGYMGGANPEAELRSAMAFIGKYNATLNPSSGGFDAADIRATLLRGISIYPWTFRGDINTYKSYLLWGYSGLTGDNADVLGHLAKSVAYTGETAFQVGDTLPLSLAVTNYRHETKDKEADVTVLTAADPLTGEDLYTLTDDTLTFTGAGEITLILSYRQRISRTEDYTLHTQVITVTVEAPETEPVTDPVTDPETDPVTDPVTEPVTEPITLPDTDPVTEAPTEGKDSDTGCASALAGLGTVAVLLTTAAAALIKRRKD